MKMTGRIVAFRSSFSAKHTLSKARDATKLLVFQLICLTLLIAIIVLTALISHGERQLLYILLLCGLSIVIFFALLFNLNGKLVVSTWLTALWMVLGPWISIMLDPNVLAGDFLPLIYVALSIQLCSILLRLRMAIIITLVQLGAVSAFILFTPAWKTINWPSLITIIVCISVVGVIYSYFNKRQMDEIEKQHNQLLLEEAKLRVLSVRDSLTGLYNRRYMEETFDREIQRAIRKQQPLSVVMADIDGFKNINDTAGHVLGDKVLVKVSTFLMKSIRASDVACRFGGDEFCLILPDCTLEEGIKRANALRRAIEEFSAESKDGIAAFTLSFGVSAMPNDGMSREALLGAADIALYTSKRAGRNCVNGTRRHA